VKERAMTRLDVEAVERLIDVVKEALETGRASTSDLEEWLLAAIALEELALEEEADAFEIRTFVTWMGPEATRH
jgi:hypothetical protein